MAANDNKTSKQGKSSPTISLRVMVCVLLFLAIIFQALMFISAIDRSGSLTNARQGTVDHFKLEVQSAGSDLSNRMTQYWGDLDSAAQLVETDIDKALSSKGYSSADLTTGSAASTLALNAAFDTLLNSALAENDGVFIVLTNGGEEQDAKALQDGNLQRDGIYLRDSNMKSRSLNYSDILLATSSVSLAKSSKIALDSDWQTRFVLPDNVEDRQFFTNTVQVSNQNPALSSSQLANWSVCTTASGSLKQSLVYAIPLRDTSSNTYGVMGIEIRLTSIASILPDQLLDPNGSQGATLSLGKKADQITDGTLRYDVLVSAGSSSALYVKDSSLQINTAESFNYIQPVVDVANENAVADTVDLKLYDDQSPYASDQWFLIGFEPENQLFRDANSLGKNIGLSVLTSILVSILLTTAVAWFLTSRINLVTRSMREASANAPFRFETTGIREFDQLAKQLEHYSLEVQQSFSRLSRVLRMTGQNVSAYERVGNTDTLVFTDDYIAMIELAEMPGVTPEIVENARRGLLTFDELRAIDDIYRPFTANSEHSESSFVVLLELPSGKWIRQIASLGEDGKPEFGCFIDVTEEMRVRQKLEEERDHDILTGLLNRRAFEEQVAKELSETGEGRVSAIAMIDLDDLKGVNDGFGHDVGDRYIKTAAQHLERAVRSGDYLSRISGDEFMLFITSANSEEEVFQRLSEAQENLAADPFHIRGGFQRVITCSIGVAFAPVHGSSFQELKTLADEAMYHVKRNGKNSVHIYGRQGFPSG